MCHNNSVYPQDIKSVLKKFERDYSFSWNSEDEFLDNLSEADFKRIYAYRGKLVCAKPVHYEMKPVDLNFRMACEERLCYVKNGKLIPASKRKPVPYHKKVRGNIGMHEDLPIMYDGDEIIVIIGLTDGSGPETLWIIDLTTDEYKSITEIL